MEMRRLRFLLAFLAPLAGLLLFADPAFATAYGGEGIYGATNLTEVTNAMFFVLLLIPVLIIVLSLLQGWLDRRRHDKLAAEKALAQAEPHKGGW
jgi:multisubunit Na+/H+ antiporter MnhB subunit